jgi:phosphopantothenoylcysteine decarboxylase/phosphopantothenate--cysteine ligase
MGVALAAEAARRGAEVTLLAAHVAVPVPDGVDAVATPTAADLEREALARAAAADVVVMAAAVADYRPAEPLAAKRPKDTAAWTVELEPTADVLAALGERRRDGQVLVGFAAEHGAEAVRTARAKLAAKRIDAIVVNDISRSDIGFDSDHNEVTILIAGETPEEHRIARASKAAVAEQILDAVERLRERGQLAALRDGAGPALRAPLS